MRRGLSWLALAAVAALAGCAGPTAPLGGQQSYQALGHEPGWILTIRNARLRFVGSDPRTVMEIVPPLPEALPYGSRYASERLTLEITRRPCNDTRSGIAFSDTVSVVVDGYNYQGCGGERVPLLDL